MRQQHQEDHQIGHEGHGAGGLDQQDSHCRSGKYVQGKAGPVPARRGMRKLRHRCPGELRDTAKQQQAESSDRIAENRRSDTRQTGQQNEYPKILRGRFFRPQHRQAPLDQRPQQKAVEEIVLFAGHVSQLAPGKLRGAEFALDMRNRAGTHPAVRDDRPRTIGLDRSPQQRRANLPFVRDIDHRDQPRGVERDDPEPALVEIDPFEFLIFLGLQHREQQFLRRSAQLADNFVIRHDAVGDIDDMILLAGILHQIAGAADIFRIQTLLLHRIDFLQGKSVPVSRIWGSRTMKRNVSPIHRGSHPVKPSDILPMKARWARLNPSFSPDGPRRQRPHVAACARSPDRPVPNGLPHRPAAGFW